MRVPFTAFAEDSIVHGDLIMPDGRLSDLLAQEGPFQSERVTVEALDDGRTVSVGQASLWRDDLVAITGSGPRGDSARRIRTRPHPTRLQAGPYEIVGYVHAPPSGHPFNGLLKRRVLPVTSAVIRYEVTGRLVELACDALLCNPAKIDWLEPASNEDLRLGETLDIRGRIDPNAKDKTGELFV